MNLHLLFRMVVLRRTVQTFLFLLFLYFLIGTLLSGTDQTRTPVKFFFYLDPLVLFSAWLGGGEIQGLLYLSLITLAFTLVMGRFFCGWVCPLGAVHNFFSWLRPDKRARLVATGYWTPWQRSKYYLFIGLAVSALLGMNWIGLFDPIPFLYRSFTNSIYPAFQAGIVALFTWLYQADPLHVTVVSEPVYDFLKAHVLAPMDPNHPKPQYLGALLIGSLFVLAVGLNFWRTRFWCRYICPLGALLGVCSRYTVFKLKNDPNQCGGCNVCVAVCQGAADPHRQEGWNASECFFCWSCRDVCPTKAISYRFEAPSLHVLGAPRQSNNKSAVKKPAEEIHG